MKSRTRYFLKTSVVCIVSTIVGALVATAGSIYYSDVNVLMVIGGILVGPALFCAFLISYVTQNLPTVITVSLLFQYISYLSFAFALRWLFEKKEFKLWMGNYVKEKKYFKYGVRLFVLFLLVILFIYAYQFPERSTGEIWLKELLSLVKNGKCEEAFLGFRGEPIRDLEKIKNIALGEKHVKISRYDCHIKSISNELKKNMTQEQINELRPLDLFCWCAEHYNYFFQDNYELVIRSIGKGAYYNHEILQMYNLIHFP